VSYTRHSRTRFLSTLEYLDNTGYFVPVSSSLRWYGPALARRVNGGRSICGPWWSLVECDKTCHIIWPMDHTSVALVTFGSLSQDSCDDVSELRFVKLVGVLTYERVPPVRDANTINRRIVRVVKRHIGFFGMQVVEHASKVDQCNVRPLITISPCPIPNVSIAKLTR
jgi:hypothetical protein